MTKKKKAAVVKVKRPRGRPKKYTTTEEAYDANMEKSRERGEKLSREGRDIAPLPEVENAQRKEACRNDFMLFCKTYLLTTFGLT